MAVPTVAHNEATPAGTDNLSAGDDRIREFKTQVREIVAVDHKMDSSGSGATWGYHKSIRLIEAADLGTGAVGATILGSQTVGGEGELVYTDEGNTDVQITSLGSVKITAASVAAIGANVDFGAYSVTAQTLISDVATGTAPFTVASTTVVTNLNADLLDGYSYNETELKPLGARVSKSNNTSYLAATDGIVEVILTSSHAAAISYGHSIGYTDAANPPTTVMAQTQVSYEGSASDFCGWGSFRMHVKAGEYYKVVLTDGGGGGGAVTQTIYWLPMGV